MALVKLAGGTLYDPANGIDGEVRDLWVRDGKVISPPSDELPDRVFDLSGLVVMPGGVDMHAHIAGHHAGRRCCAPAPPAARRPRS
jgi:formylmethanofuran dehydrogenase subunit A